MSELTENMDNVSLRSLRTKQQNVNYGDVSVLSDDMMGFNIASFGEEDRRDNIVINEQKSDQTTQPPRPPRVANRSRKPAGHEPRDEFYTPEGAITSIITRLEPLLVRYTKGNDIFFSFSRTRIKFIFSL